MSKPSDEEMGAAHAKGKAGFFDDRGLDDSPYSGFLREAWESGWLEGLQDLHAAARDIYEALWQLLDDMGEDRFCVCPAAKEQAIAALSKARGEG